MNIDATRRSVLLGATASCFAATIARADGASQPSTTSNATNNLVFTEQLEHTSVIINCNTKVGTSQGTGFVFFLFNFKEQAIPVIVTNKHVVRDATAGAFTFTLAKPDKSPDLNNVTTIEIPNFSQQWIQHPDQDVELAIFPLAPLMRQFESQGRPIFLKAFNPDHILPDANLNLLTPVEEILVVGYPNGISDTTHNIPVIRRGITATPAYLSFRGKDEFLIDAAIYPGSSGSPVLLYNQGAWANRTGATVVGTRFALLGVVFGVFNSSANGEIKVVPAPTQWRTTVTSLIPNNLGVCVKASHILDFEPLLVERGLIKVPDGYVMRSAKS